MTVVNLQNDEPKPLVSIIIPVYNRIDLLRETIASVQAQTITNWELIVVDDGSQEDVTAVLPVDGNGRFRLIQQKNQGNAAARNRGIQQARGQYIACLDSDDIWDATMLSSCIDLLQKNPAVDIVYTQFQRIDVHGQNLSATAEPIDPPQGDLLAALLLGLPILPSSALARRTCFERWGAYTVGLDDWEQWLRWAAGGCVFGCIQQPLLKYRVHNQNLSAAWQKRRQTHFAMLDAFYKNENLPTQANTMQAHAYANQHILFCEMALQTGNIEAAQAEYYSAVLSNPIYLTDVDTYYRLACAHQGRVETNLQHKLDIGRAEKELLDLLEALAVDTNLPTQIEQKLPTAHAYVYMALAQIAYGMAGDGATARQFLRQAARCWPPIVGRQGWSAWLLRALVGQKRVQKAKTVRQKEKEQTTLAGR